MRLHSRWHKLLPPSFLVAVLLGSVGVALAMTGAADSQVSAARAKPIQPDPDRSRPGRPDGGGNPGGKLRVEIKPSAWNTNWESSPGRPVSVVLRGDGAERVNLNSIRLVGDDAAALPLSPFEVRRVGKQIEARFARQNAYAALNDPDQGETHVVKVRFSVGNDVPEKKLAVKIVGQ
jgi:hypothetical protein